MAAELQRELLPGRPGDSTVTADDERAAACAFAGLSGIGSHSLSLIREAFGSLAAAASRGGKAVASAPGLRVDGVAALQAAPDLQQRGRWLLEKSGALGARVMVLEDDDYPPLLKSVSSPPPVLYLMGKLVPNRRVAVVGTRKADDYGRERTRTVVDFLCAAGVEVVSGGALGVDTEAHTRTLDRGGRTTAIVGSGLLNPYPRQNIKLFDRIATQGALITEFALDAGGNNSHYPQRNRTIAGLSEAVVITRGDEGSGALTTCTSAQRFGRPVFAVPGAVGDALAWAPNSLLSTGARALVTGSEVLAALNLAAPDPVAVAVQPAATQSSSAAREGLPPAVRKVFDTLGPSPRHIDEIATAAGVPSSEAMAVLLRLELDGLCVARPGMHYLRR